MRQDRLARVVLALADHERRHQRRGRGVDVDDGAAGEVERPELGQEASPPDPVRDRRVHDQAPERDEHEVGEEAHPLDDRARDERGCDDRERPLVGHEQDLRDRALRLEADAGEKRLREVAHDRRALGEGEAVAEQRPGDTHEAERRDAHHHGVEGVLGAHQASVEKRQRRRHQQHERGGDEHEGHVGRNDHRCVQEPTSCLGCPPDDARRVRGPAVTAGGAQGDASQSVGRKPTPCRTRQGANKIVGGAGGEPTRL